MAAVVRLAGEGASADAKGGDYGNPAVVEAALDGHTVVSDFERGIVSLI